MTLDVVTPAFSTASSYQAVSHQKELADIHNNRVQHQKETDSQPADFVIKKDEILSILSLGMPTLHNLAEPITEELHAIDIFA